MPYFLKYFRYKNKAAITENPKKNNEDYFAPVTQLNKLVLADSLGLKNDEEFKIVLAETIRLTTLKIQFYEDFSKKINEMNYLDAERTRYQNKRN